MNYSNYDVDTGHLLNLLGSKNLASSKFKELRWFTLHGLAPGYFSSNARGEKSHITYGTLRINSMCHCRAQTIIKVALAIVVPFFGTVLLTTLRKAKYLRQFKRLPNYKRDVYLIMNKG